MRILLLGGSGFIGEHLAEKLSAKKSCAIVATYNNNLPLGVTSKNVSYIKIDLAKASSKLEKIVNLADVIVISTQPNKKIIDNLISSAKTKSHLKKIIYLSSALVYDNFNDKQNEKFPVRPMTDYEVAKYEEEAVLSKFIQKNDLKLCIVRLANVYGDVKNRGLINHIYLAILNNGKISINGKGDSRRDYIFIEDVVAWLDFLVFWNQKNKKEVVNICTGRGYGVKEIVEKVEQVVEKKVKLVFGVPIQEKKMIIGDNKKIIKLSKMKLKYDLIKGLQQTYKNYLK